MSREKYQKKDIIYKLTSDTTAKITHRLVLQRLVGKSGQWGMVKGTQQAAQ